MTSTVLTNEQIRGLGEEWSCFFPQVGYEDDCIRDIEQAVLQSEQVQAWKKDAERYRWLKENSLDDWREDDGMALVAPRISISNIDAAVDHARAATDIGEKMS